MTFNNLDKSLERFEQDVKESASVLSSSLHNKMIFFMKLTNLRVYIAPTSTLTVATCGLCSQKFDELSLFLVINPTEPDDYISFVIAHELAHLLLKKVTDLLAVTGRANDGSTELTSIMRLTSDSQEYGRELEEQVADLIALFILKKRNIELSDFTKKKLEKTSKKRKAVERFINIFGCSLESCNFIDDYEEKDDVKVVKNSFWYYAVTSGLSAIVNYFDDGLGDFAFFNMCEALEKGDVAFVNKAVREFKRYDKEQSAMLDC